jgi:general secretion pathway protein A
MYESFYGLKEKPFALNPDPAFIFLAAPHRKALTMLEYSLANEAPFCLISGEVGSGKTTLIRHLLNNLEQTITVGLISNTSLYFGRLLQWICMSFGLEYKDQDEVALYEVFTRFLIAQYAKGHRVVLIVDEAQNLGRERLEELRPRRDDDAAVMRGHFLVRALQLRLVTVGARDANLRVVGNDDGR